MPMQWKGDGFRPEGEYGVDRPVERIGFEGWEEVRARLKELGRVWRGTTEQKILYRHLKQRERELAAAGRGEDPGSWSARQRYYQRRRMDDAKARPDRRLETGKGGKASSRGLRGWGSVA